MITLIACVDENMGIGKGDGLLIHLPKDLKHFRDTTIGQVCVFGRKTYESLPTPLSGRVKVILSNKKGYKPIDKDSQIRSFEQIMELSEHKDIFICGGESVYRQFIPYADELIISHMKASFDADTFFPDIDKSIWEDYDSESIVDKVEFEIVKYRRKSNNTERGKSMTITTADIKGKSIKELVMEHGEKAVLEAVSQKIRGFEVVKDEHRKNKGVEIQKPKRGTSRSAGYDFFSPIDVTIGVGEQKMIWLDVKAYMQSNEVLLIDVRSSQGKPRIRLANTIGVIDSDYYGNVKNDGNIGIMLENHGSQPYVIKTGDRIAQGIFTVYLVADEDECINETRKGGYGSTN